MFLACKLTGALPAASLYIGDDERDILAGRAAGMAVVAAAYGYLGENNEPEKWQADHLIHLPSDIIALVQKLTYSNTDVHNRS